MCRRLEYRVDSMNKLGANSGASVDLVLVQEALIPAHECRGGVAEELEAESRFA